MCIFLEENYCGVEDGYFIGDSGYVCFRFLIMFYLYFVNLLEEVFNMVYCCICNVVERVFGWWKRRFYVLYSEIKMKFVKVCKIIGVCVILYNIVIFFKEEMDDEDEEDVNVVVYLVYWGFEDGRVIRNFIIRIYF